MKENGFPLHSCSIILPLEITLHERKAGGIQSVSSVSGPAPVIHFWIWIDRHNANEDDTAILLPSWGLNLTFDLLPPSTVCITLEYKRCHITALLFFSTFHTENTQILLKFVQKF